MSRTSDQRLGGTRVRVPLSVILIDILQAFCSQFNKVNDGMVPEQKLWLLTALSLPLELIAKGPNQSDVTTVAFPVHETHYYFAMFAFAYHKIPIKN